MRTPTLTDIDLSTEDDTVLDGMLHRLYAEHVAAEGDAREDCHLKIMVIVGELSRRADVWLASRGQPA